MFEVSQQRGAAQWDVVFRRLSSSIRHSFLSLTLYLRNREPLPLGSRGNNEVPAENGGSTTER